MTHRLRGLIYRFGQSRDGNFAIMLASLMIPIVGALGFAVDYAGAVSTRAELQQALDSAVMAAASKGGTLDATFAARYFLPNVKTSGLSIGTPDFSTDADGVITGTVSATMPTTLMGVLGVPSIALTVSSKATQVKVTKIITATMQITNTQGAYDKEIWFFTRNASGTILTETKILDYDYTSNGKTTSVVNTPAKTSSTTINVGDYASYGYKMVVYEDLTYKGGRKGKVYNYYSDQSFNDPTSTVGLKRTGKCSDANGETSNWEDGGDTNFLDFVYKTTCTEALVATGDVRLAS